MREGVSTLSSVGEREAMEWREREGKRGREEARVSRGG